MRIRYFLRIMGNAQVSSVGTPNSLQVTVPVSAAELAAFPNNKDPKHFRLLILIQCGIKHILLRNNDVAT